MELLVISKGGVYKGGAYCGFRIDTPDPVLLQDVAFTGSGAGDLGTSSSRPDLALANCTFAAPAIAGAPVLQHAVVFWRFRRFFMANCTFNGTAGVVLMDNAAEQVHAFANRFNNISGATSATARLKTSALQLDNVHCGDIEVAFNAVVNARGQSATEDAISLAVSGGLPGKPALIRQNLVDGVFGWPADGSNFSGSDFSGSGIMCFDPSTSSGLTVGGYTRCTGNTVIASENAGIDCAGSHDIEIDSNRVVNDGTATLNTSVGLRTWNWAGKTPAASLGPFNVHDNRACWLRGPQKARADYSLIEPQTSGANNVSSADSDAAARADWWAMVAGLGLRIGAVSPTRDATAVTAGTLYDAAAAGVQRVPLPQENLGPATAAGYLAPGTWVRFNAMEFAGGELAGVKTLTCRLGAIAAGTIDVRVDSASGPVIATLVFASTGGWYAYQPLTVPLALPSLEGVHDLYFVPRAGAANLASFVFA